MIARTLVALLVAACAGHAAAQDRAITMPPPGRTRLSARWDTVFHTGTDTFASLPLPGTLASPRFTSWSNVLSIEVDLGDALFRTVVPMTYEMISEGGPLFGPASQAELGNVQLEGYANIGVGARAHRLLLGGGVALPTATDQGSGNWVRLLAWETSFRGAPLWAEQALSVSPSIDYRFAIPWLWIGATGTASVFFPIAANGGPQVLARGRVELMLALDAAIALRVLDMVDVGVSFLAWALPTGVGADSLDPLRFVDLGQTALTLSVRSDRLLDAPVFGGVEMIFDLDHEWGPTGAPGKLWGLHAFFGGRLDV